MTGDSFKILLSLLIFAGLNTGCVSAKQDHYYWGNYESLIHKIYAEYGTIDPTMQIETLTTDLQIAESKGKPAPPGLYVHLGFMYAMKGEVSQAETAFNAEKKLFPESAVCIDGMLERSINNAPTSAPPK